MNLKKCNHSFKKIKTKYLIKPFRTPRYTKHRDNTRHFIPQEAIFRTIKEHILHANMRHFEKQVTT